MKTPRKHKFKAVFSLIIAVNIGLVFLQLFFANNLATEGKTLKKVQVEAEKIKSENDKLKEQIVILSSLSKIEEEAVKLGMIKVSSLEFILSTEVASVQ